MCESSRARAHLAPPRVHATPAALCAYLLRCPVAPYREVLPMSLPVVLAEALQRSVDVPACGARVGERTRPRTKPNPAPTSTHHSPHHTPVVLRAPPLRAEKGMVGHGGRVVGAVLRVNSYPEHGHGLEGEPCRGRCVSGAARMPPPPPPHPPHRGARTLSLRQFASHGQQKVGCVGGWGVVVRG